jgi:uncharacterized membrane protein (DUF4010 family)
MPETPDIFQRLAVALALGLVIGMERGWKTRDFEPGERVAGVRTFGVVSFLGGLSALLSLQTGAATLAAALLAVAGMLGVNHWYALRDQDADVGTTTLIAALTTFGLGATAGLGHLAVAGAGAVVIALVLGVKRELHQFVAKLEERELRAGLQVLAISVVLLPILPDADYGPLGAINPYEIWWMVVLIAGLSFLGYIAIRVAGAAHGVMLTGLIGGFASSTVIALNMGRLAKRANDSGGTRHDALLAAGAVAALATMYPRVAVIVIAIAPNLGVMLLWGLVPAALAALATVALRWRRAARISDADSVLPRKPFQLSVALEFAVILTAIMLAVEAARLWLGESGLYALALLAGLFDVDAISLSYAQMAAEGNALPGITVVGIALAVLANMLVKPLLVAGLGAPRMALHMLLPLLGATLAGLGGLALGAVWGAIPLQTTGAALPWTRVLT